MRYSPRSRKQKQNSNNCRRCPTRNKPRKYIEKKTRKYDSHAGIYTHICISTLCYLHPLFSSAMQVNFSVTPTLRDCNVAYVLLCCAVLIISRLISTFFFHIREVVLSGSDEARRQGVSGTIQTPFRPSRQLPGFSCTTIYLVQNALFATFFLATVDGTKRLQRVF